MKKIRACLAFLFSLLFILQTVPASAMDSVMPCNQDSGYANVFIGPEAKDVPQEVIDDLVAENGEDSVITIWKYEEATPEPMPRATMFFLESKTVTESKALEGDYFIISVAKGSKKTLSKKFSKTLSASCSESVAKASLSLGSSITAEYSTTYEFSGPPENSTSNSREFRVKFYEDRGTFTGILDFELMHSERVSGTWTSPHSYTEYSIDKKVS